MPRNERIVYGADLLDAFAFLPRGRRQPEGSIRRSISSAHQQHWEDARQRAQEVQLPAETLQSRAQGAVQEGFGLLRELAQFLREEPQVGHRRHPGSRLQRDVDRRWRLRPDVLRKRLQNGGEGGGRAMCLHFPLVLRSQVQSLPDQENDPHLSVDEELGEIQPPPAIQNLFYPINKYSSDNCYFSPSQTTYEKTKTKIVRLINTVPWIQLCVCVYLGVCSLHLLFPISPNTFYPSSLPLPTPFVLIQTSHRLLSQYAYDLCLVGIGLVFFPRPISCPYLKYYFLHFFKNNFRYEFTPNLDFPPPSTVYKEYSPMFFSALFIRWIWNRVTILSCSLYSPKNPILSSRRNPSSRSHCWYQTLYIYIIYVATRVFV